LISLFDSIPSQLQQFQKKSIARFKFKGVVPGISHYNRLAGPIDWLEAAGLIIKIPIYLAGNLTGLIGKLFKTYPL